MGRANDGDRHARPDRVQNIQPLSRDAADYEIVRRAIAFISERWRAQPEIEAIADGAGVTPTESAPSVPPLGRTHAQGIPAGAHARSRAPAAARLRERARCHLSRSACPDRGGCTICSSPTRRCRPGEWKSGGDGLTISYGFHPVSVRHRAGDGDRARPCGLAFADPGEEQAALADMRGRWPRANIVADGARTAPLARRIFDTKLWRADRPLRVVLIGTDFEVRVWETLLRIPMGRATTYSDIAGKLGSDQSRARGRRRGRQEPDHRSWCRATAYRQGRRHHRLSLGPHAQARHAGLGGGALAAG